MQHEGGRYHGSPRGGSRIHGIHGNYNTSVGERIMGLLVTVSHRVPDKESYNRLIKHND